ncbi:death domain-containing membrane protein NRADD-like [Pan paniscus]|uniref:death domain-containing membrane protein NRADD-like n=1 Tax=Pan paniscus TaxID=9597 RepID=UPI002436D87C|nr:death domain-containing membrane protein NRADD-like [Pan paniscus]
MIHNSSHSKVLAYVGKILRRQERDREGVWVGAGGALAPNTSSPFLLESPRGLRQHHPSLLYPPGHCGPRSACLHGLQVAAGAHINKDSSWPKLELQSWEVSTRTRCMGTAVSSWTLLAVWSPVPPARHQEKVERLLEVSREPDKGWRGLADHLGYQAEAVEIMAQGQV